MNVSTLTRPVLADAAEVVAPEVDEHHVLGALLGVGQQVSAIRASSSGVAPRGRVPAIGRVDAWRPLTVSSGSGRRAGDLEVAEVQEVHVRARVDHAQAAVDRERVDASSGAPSAGTARPGRRRRRGRTRRSARPCPRTARGACWTRSRHRAGRRARGSGCGHRPGEQAARLGDRRDRVGVGRLEVALVGVDVDDDRDRVLEVVEDDQHVGEHQRHVGQAEHVRVRRRPAWSRRCARGRSRRTRRRRRRTAAASANGAWR